MFYEECAFVSLLTLGTLGLALWWFGACKKHSFFPPGPQGYPFLGVLPYFSKKSPQQYYSECGLKKYGPVMSAKLLGRKIVVLNTFDAIKEVFDLKGSKSSGRMTPFLFKQLQGCNGYTYLDGTKYFFSQKELVVNFLKSFGGSDGFDKAINEEIDIFLKSLESEVEKSMEFRRNLFDMAMNIVMKIILGKRNEYRNETASLLYQNVEHMFGDAGDAKLLFLVETRPFLRYFPPMCFAYFRFLKRGKIVMEWIKNFVKVVRKNVDVVDPSCFVSCFLKNEEELRKGNENGYDNQLEACIREFFAGAKGVCSPLHWIFFYCVSFPEEYKKIVAEIEKEFGRDGVPTTETQSRMPLTCAFIEEVLRIASPLPKPLEHKAQAEIRVGKYVFPKGTEIFGNFWGANHNPNDWPQPEKFDPSRHIDADGNMISSSRVIQFSLGPRFCIGRDISKSIMFLVLTRVLHRYEISSDPDKKLPNPEEGFLGITYDSQPYHVILKPKF